MIGKALYFVNRLSLSCQSLFALITAKPKKNTLLSISLFLVLAYTLAILNLNILIKDPTSPWYNYALFLVLGPLALGLTLRMLFNYKILQFGKNQILIRYPVRFSHQKYSLKDLSSWKEAKVKTMANPYKELELRFSNGKNAKLSLQEHTDYEKVVKYLEKKCAKKRLI